MLTLFFLLIILVFYNLLSDIIQRCSLYRDRKDGATTTASPRGPRCKLTLYYQMMNSKSWRLHFKEWSLFIPKLFFKKSEGDIVIPSVCLSVHPPVHLSVMLSPPKPLDEIQPNLVCELLTLKGRATAKSRPLRPGEGSKGQILFNFNFKVNFKDFYMFSQMKDTKHIRQDLILLPGSCPRGRTQWRWGCQGGSDIIFFKHGHVAHQIDGMTSRTECK